MAIKIRLVSKFLTLVLLITAVLSAHDFASAVENSSYRFNWRSATEKLGLAADANEETIKKAYRKLSRQSHPDLVGNDSKMEEFKAYQAAFQYLKEQNFADPDKPQPTSQQSNSASQSDRPEDTNRQQAPRSQPRPVLKDELVAFIFRGQWNMDRIASVNRDGSYNTHRGFIVREFSRTVLNPQYLNRVVIVHTQPQYQVSRIMVEFENGTVLLENNVLAGAQTYAFEIPNHPLVGKSVYVNYTHKGASETVLRVFADGSVQTNQNSALRREHYSTELPKASKAGRMVMVRRTGKTPFGDYVYIQAEKVLQEFATGDIITDHSNGKPLHNSTFSEEVANSSLVGTEVLMRVGFNSHVYPVRLVVQRHFTDGSVYFGEQHFFTTSISVASAAEYAKEVKQSPLIGKTCIIRDSRKWQSKIIERVFEDGTILTNNGMADPNSYSVEAKNHTLVGKTVYVQEQQGYTKQTVQKVFEDGTLLTTTKSIVEPNTYAVTKPSDRVGEAIIVFLSDGNYRIDTVQDIVAENNVIDSTGAKLNPGEFQTLISPEWANKPIILRKSTKWVPGVAKHILKSGTIIANDGKFYVPADYLYPIESTLLGAEVEVPRWLGFGVRTEKVTYVFEDGSIMTEKSGYVRNYNTVTPETEVDMAPERTSSPKEDAKTRADSSAMTCEKLLGRSAN